MQTPAAGPTQRGADSAALDKAEGQAALATANAGSATAETATKPAVDDKQHSDAVPSSYQPAVKDQASTSSPAPAAAGGGPAGVKSAAAVAGSKPGNVKPAAAVAGSGPSNAKPAAAVAGSWASIAARSSAIGTRPVVQASQQPAVARHKQVAQVCHNLTAVSEATELRCVSTK